MQLRLQKKQQDVQKACSKIAQSVLLSGDFSGGRDGAGDPRLRAAAPVLRGRRGCSPGGQGAAQAAALRAGGDLRLNIRQASFDSCVIRVCVHPVIRVYVSSPKALRRVLQEKSGGGRVREVAGARCTRGFLRCLAREAV